MKLVVIVILSHLIGSDAAKILLLPCHHGSHIKLLSRIGGMLKDSGHDVYTIVSKRYASIPEEFGVTAIVPKLTNDISFTDQLIIHEKVKSFPIILYKGIPLMQRHAHDIMTDEQVMAKVEDLQFDLAIMDAVELNFPAYLIPYKLSIPNISVCTRPDAWLARVPTLPSVEGQFTYNLLTKDSTFLNRLANTPLYLTYQLLQPNSFLSPLNNATMFEELVPHKDNIGFNSLFIGSEMFLVTSNIYCVDETRATAPHYQYIPAIGATPALPLPKDLHDIVHNSLHGVILLAFGSTYTELPESMLNKLLLAFSQMKYSVIIRHVGDMPADMPANVYIRPWVPQNDILGHPNTKLFVTHMGNNGLMESVYHGVPMLMMPHCCDQFINHRKAEARGYGQIVNHADFIVAEFMKVATELIENENYTNNVHKCSEIIHSLPRASDTVEFWVNHILRFGGSHLKPYYMDMPLWKFLNLDVVIGLILLVQIVLYLLICTCTEIFLTKKHLKSE